MSTPTDRFWRERLTMRYIDALDAGDLDAIVAIWDDAAANPELEALLHELNEGLLQEEGTETDLATDAARVAELARTHMPGAFPAAAATGPLTLADVARRLEAEPEFRRLNAADRSAHARALADATTVPAALSQPQFDHWLHSLGIVAGASYRRTLRKTALLMEMARNQEAGRLAAARRAQPPPPRPKKDGAP